MSDAEDDYYGNGWQSDRDYDGPPWNWSGVKRHLEVDDLIGKKIVVSIDPADRIGGVNYFVQADNAFQGLRDRGGELAADINDARIALEDPSVRYVIVDGLQENVTRGNIDRIMEEHGMSNHKDPEFLRSEAERMLQRAAILEQVPRIDNFEDGTMLYFEKQFQGHTYMYVAIRVVGTWHVTGPKSPNGVFWNELIDFIGIGNLTSAKVVTAAVTLFDYVKVQQAALTETEETTE